MRIAHRTGLCRSGASSPRSAGHSDPVHHGGARQDVLASRECGWLLQPLLKKRPHVKLRLLCHSTARHRFGVTFFGVTRGILDAISIRRRQGCSHEPSQREPILVELGKGSCISRSSFSFSSEAGGTFGRREPAAAAASALGPAEGMAAFGAGTDPASAAAAGAVASETRRRCSRRGSKYAAPRCPQRLHTAVNASRTAL